MLISRFSKSISKLLKTVRFPISSFFGERTVGKNKMTNGWAKCQKEKTTKYSRKFGGFGVPGAIRTRGLSLRRRTLYPAELRAHIMKFVKNKLRLPIPYVFPKRHHRVPNRVPNFRSCCDKVGISAFITRFLAFPAVSGGQSNTLGGGCSIQLSYWRI